MKKERKEVLEKYIYKDTPSIALFDQFDGIGEKNKVIYNRLVIMNKYQAITTDGGFCQYRLVIERGYSKDQAGTMSFTELKLSKVQELHQYIKEQLNKRIIDQYSSNKKLYRFKKPFGLRAQNSMDRIGYGYIDLQYGETHDYLVVGVYIY